MLFNRSAVPRRKGHFKTTEKLVKARVLGEQASMILLVKVKQIFYSAPAFLSSDINVEVNKP